MPELNADLKLFPEPLENGNFHETFHATSGSVQRPLTVNIQAIFELNALDFYKLKKGDNPITKYTWEVFIISAGYAVLLLAKFFTKATIESWQKLALIIAIVSFIILQFIIKYFFPSDSKKVLEKIDMFFKENQPHSEINKNKL
jgi:hypothetical protein